MSVDELVSKGANAPMLTILVGLTETLCIHPYSLALALPLPSEVELHSNSRSLASSLLKR